MRLAFYNERMKVFVALLKYDVILGKNRKSKKKARNYCAKNYFYFKYAGNDHMMHANGSIEKESLGSLVINYKNWCPVFFVLLCN